MRGHITEEQTEHVLDRTPGNRMTFEAVHELITASGAKEAEAAFLLVEQVERTGSVTAPAA